MTGRRRMTPDMTTQAGEAYTTHMSVRAVADEIGVSYTAARHAIRRSGVPLRSRGRQSRDLPTELVRDVIDRYEAGESLRKIAASSPLLSKSIADRVLREAGVPLRRPGRQPQRR